MKRTLSLSYTILFAVILIAGFLLRVVPMPGRSIWTYDQARDSYVIRSIIAQHHLIITGPQTEYVGLSHGPLYYYLMSPFYALSHGDQVLPSIAMGLLNFSAVIPIYLLGAALFRTKKTGVLAAGIFLLSYQEIEYARWLSNVAVSIPFLAWSYYFFHRVFTNKQEALWVFAALGVCLGLTMQAELFFLSVIAFVSIALWIRRCSLKQLGVYILGLALGGSSFIVSELKFHFLGSRTFVTQFLASHGSVELPTTNAVNSYIDHVGLTIHQLIGGISNPMGFVLFVALVLGSLYLVIRPTGSRYRPAVFFLGLLFCFHAVLFTFHFVNAVFLDIGFTIPAILLATFVLHMLWQQHRRLALVLVALMFVSTVINYKNYLFGDKPFATYSFIQDGILFQQKIVMVDRMYELTGGKPFSFASVGTPYGVRTVWASVFEQYARVHHTALPHWFGYVANGYPGETLLPSQDFPDHFHILVIESNVENLLPPTVLSQRLASEDKTTRLLQEVRLDGFIIQLRTPLNK